MSPTDRATWVQTLTEYRNAYKIARKVWPENTPPDVLARAAATIFIAHEKLVRPAPQWRGNRQPQRS